MFTRPILVFALLASLGFTAQVHSAPTASFDYYSAGDLKAPTPGKTEGALMLLGGGDWPVPAFRWFVDKMGHGRLLIISASYGEEIQQDFLKEIGGVTGVETLVFHSREAASDPRVLDMIRRADGIFFGGGDQSNYVRYFKGTPMNELHDAHVRGGKPIGGTSAGLAILGAFSYGAMDGGSLVSKDAMKNPLGSGVTIVGDFLHLPYLSHVITDSHFAARERWGRLLVFVGRIATEQREPGITGIGIDEKAALCIDADGTGRVYANGRGFAWVVRPMRAPDVLSKARFNFRDVPVVGVGAESVIDMNTFAVTRPSFTLKVSIVNGAFDAASFAALKAEAVTPVPQAAVAQAKPWSLAIHGGAGVIEAGDLTPEKESP